MEDDVIDIAKFAAAAVESVDEPKRKKVKKERRAKARWKDAQKKGGKRRRDEHPSTDSSAVTKNKSKKTMPKAKVTVQLESFTFGFGEGSGLDGVEAEGSVQDEHGRKQCKR
eukprot:COSAG05_NODE_4_length_49189_cov_157.128784_5_plen_112_part_00